VALIPIITLYIVLMHSINGVSSRSIMCALLLQVEVSGDLGVDSTLCLGGPVLVDEVLESA
jgi:hypothetical protein